MAKDHVYHWKHGWIPLTHTAAMSKAKGNREKAAELLAEAKSEHAGIHKREHVGKAALDLTSISDPKHRADALVDVQDAAERLGAVDSLPSALRRPSSTPRDLSRTQLADGSHVQIRREQGKGGDVIAVRKLTQNPLTGEVSPAALAAAPYVEHATPDLMRQLGVRDEDMPAVMDLVKGKSTPKAAAPKGDVVNDVSGRPAYVRTTEGKRESRHFPDGSLTILDKSKPGGTPRTIGHVGPNPDRAFDMPEAAPKAAPKGRAKGIILDGRTDEDRYHYRTHDGQLEPQNDAMARRLARLEASWRKAQREGKPVEADKAHREFARLTGERPGAVSYQPGALRDTPKAAEPALPGTDANPHVKTSISASEAKPGDSIILPNGGRMTVASVEPGPHGLVTITGTTGRAVTVSPRQAMSRFDGATAPTESKVDPFREGARQHVDAAKHKVGDAVSIRGQANSRVTVVEIKDGRARVQHAGQSGAQGTWMPLGKLVPYGTDTGRETPMGGRPVPGTGSTGSSIRRR